MKKVIIYQKENCVVNATHVAQTKVPCLLFVTMEEVFLDGNKARATKLSIRGLENPLPFTQAIIPNLKGNIEMWLKLHGYKRIGHTYV